MVTRCSEKTVEVGEENLESSQHIADMSVEISLLRIDTAELNHEIRKLKKDKSKLNNELERHQRGVFLGLGFGYNYFINGPRTYYVRPDSTIGRYGRTSGMSFMFSGFVAYKITERHSIIFNMPLGDITNREDYRVGLFNKRIAGGLGYGYNMGNISIVGIVNVSPYEEIEYDLIRDQQVNEEAYTPVNQSGYPTSTFYSPSFTIGFSYNFLAPEKFWMNSF